LAFWVVPSGLGGVERNGWDGMNTAKRGCAELGLGGRSGGNSGVEWVENSGNGTVSNSRPFGTLGVDEWNDGGQKSPPIFLLGTPNPGLAERRYYGRSKAWSWIIDEIRAEKISRPKTAPLALKLLKRRVIASATPVTQGMGARGPPRQNGRTRHLAMAISAKRYGDLQRYGESDLVWFVIIRTWGTSAFDQG
jgi:hypothetical protein